jgi:predicted DCC family thiol-disulfide oxidoreductase YuxK
MNAVEKRSRQSEPGSREDADPPIPNSGTDARTAEDAVIYFDGVCGLCNRLIDFVLPRDTRHVFRFAPLQGETAHRRLSPSDVEGLPSVVLADKNGTFRESSAVVRILRLLGGPWKLAAGLLWLIPRPIRNVGYRFVARRRYRWFGKKETCRMPAPDEREYFLP